LPVAEDGLFLSSKYMVFDKKSIPMVACSIHAVIETCKFSRRCVARLLLRWTAVQSRSSWQARLPDKVHGVYSTDLVCVVKLVVHESCYDAVSTH